MTDQKRPRNLIDLYTYAYRDQHAHEKFVKWTAISGVAACLATRVYVVGRNGDQTVPNLYVMLVGDSGTGKSWAMSKIVERITNAPLWDEQLNVLAGKVTFEGLIDQLAIAKIPNKNKVYLLQDEFASDIGGSIERADHFIKGLTKMFYLGRYDDITRTGARITVPVGYSLNVCWGSTYDWLVRSMPADAAAGGFFPRCNYVRAYDRLPLVFDPPAPDKADEIGELISSRLGEVMQYEGQMKWKDDAYAAYEEWFNGYIWPYDGIRADDWMRKFSMVDAAADENMEISVQNVRRAAEWVAESQDAPVDLLRKSEQNPHAITHEKLTEWIRTKHCVTRSQLALHAEHLGGMRTTALTEFIATLRDQGLIEVTIIPTGGRPRTEVEWVGDDK
jgi:hypothetical protein